jgi:hypothetical protein
MWPPDSKESGYTPPARLALKVFFEVFQSRVHYLFDTEEIGTKAFPQVDESLIHALFQVAETLIIDRKADQNGQHWQSGADGHDHQLGKRIHLQSGLIVARVLCQGSAHIMPHRVIGTVGSLDGQEYPAPSARPSGFRLGRDTSK